MARTRDMANMVIAGGVSAAMLASTLNLSGKTVTFAAGEISAAELASTLDFSGKTFTVPDGNITAAKLASTLDLSGKTLTVPDGNITAAKLASTLDLSSKTLTVPDGNITAAKLASTLDLSSKTLTLPAANRSVVVQEVNTQTGAYQSCTTAIPHDDTIPQNTEGDEVMTLAITPTSATNKLKIEVIVNAAHTAINQWIIALFQDSTANAIAACGVNTVAAGPSQGTLVHYMTAGTTSSTTFKVRIGGNTGSTLAFNGSGGARKYGGVLASSITITEIKV